VPALESAHAVAEAIRLAPTMAKTAVLMVNLSGRGDKDMGILARELKLEGATEAKA
jgi:tryptophan synthase beta chain